MLDPQKPHSRSLFVAQNWATVLAAAWVVVAALYILNWMCGGC